MEEIPDYINTLSYLFVVLYMLSVRWKRPDGEIVKMLGHLNLIGRALLANFVIIPIIGIFIARFFDLPPEMRRLFFYFLTEKERDRRVFVLAGFGTVQIVQMVESRLPSIFSPKEKRKPNQGFPDLIIFEMI